MFIREGQGVYQFGTKKVYVKIDQEKIFREISFLLTLNKFLYILFEKFVLEEGLFQLKTSCRYIRH